MISTLEISNSTISSVGFSSLNNSSGRRARHGGGGRMKKKSRGSGGGSTGNYIYSGNNSKSGGDFTALAALSTIFLFLSDYGMWLAAATEQQLPSSPLLTLPSSEMLQMFVKDSTQSVPNLARGHIQILEQLMRRDNIIRPRLPISSLLSLPDSSLLGQLLPRNYPTKYVIINEKDQLENENFARPFLSEQPYASITDISEDNSNKSTDDEGDKSSDNARPMLAAKTKKNMLQQAQEPQKLLRMSRDMGGPHHHSDNAYQIRNINDMGWFRFG